MLIIYPTILQKTDRLVRKNKLLFYCFVTFYIERRCRSPCSSCDLDGYRLCCDGNCNSVSFTKVGTSFFNPPTVMATA